MTGVVDLAADLMARPSRSRVTERSRQPVRGEDLASLLKQSADGDEEAFAAVYGATGARAYGLRLSVLQDPAQAREVVQEAYLYLWTHSALFDPASGSAISWILMSVHQRAVSRVRSATTPAAHETHVQRRIAQLGLVPNRAAADGVSVLTKVGRAHGALTELPPTQRVAVELAYFEGCTHSEVERVSDLPVGTVHGQIRDGLLNLRDMMGRK